MTDAKIEPCGNEDCDECDPRPYWKVSWRRLVFMTHRRRIKAATQEEALAIYEQGTAWPSSYDDEEGQIVSEEPVTVVQCTIENDQITEVRAELAAAGRWPDKCWNRTRTAEEQAFVDKPDLPGDELAADPISKESHGEEPAKP